MGAPRHMRPIVDDTGKLRPDLDRRWVSVSIMAQYAGVCRSTFWQQWLRGLYPREGGRLIGAYTVYQPRVILGIDKTVGAA